MPRIPPTKMKSPARAPAPGPVGAMAPSGARLRTPLGDGTSSSGGLLVVMPVLNPREPGALIAQF